MTQELRQRWLPAQDKLPELAEKCRAPGSHWNSKGHIDLAKMLGCHVNSVRGWIDGSHTPSDEALKVIDRVALRIGYEPPVTVPPTTRDI